MVGVVGVVFVLVLSVAAFTVTLACAVTGAQERLPPCDASSTQAPPPVNVTVEPISLHAPPADDGSIETVATRPDEAVT